MTVNILCIDLVVNQDKQENLVQKKYKAQKFNYFQVFNSYTVKSTVRMKLEVPAVDSLKNTKTSFFFVIH